MNKEFFKTKIKEAKKELKQYNSPNYNYNGKITCCEEVAEWEEKKIAYEKSQQAVKEALLKMLKELPNMRSVNEIINKIAKEELGIDLDEQQLSQPKEEE